MHASRFDTKRGAVLERGRGMRGNLATVAAERNGSHPVALQEMGTGVKKLAPQVLVVDDEALIRWSVAETLANKGMQVSQASDGASAISTVAHHAGPFDVVVLDLRLPDVDDLSLLLKIREMSPTSRVIIMTAFGTAEISERALELGASKVVAKPFELDEMATLVARATAAATS